MATANIDEFDLDLDDDSDSYYEDAGSSALVRKLRKELKAAKKALNERETALTSLKSEFRTRTIKDVLASNGANPKIAAFVPADIEPSEQAVNEWLNEYGDVFGFKPSTSDDGSQPASSVDAGAVGRMSAVEESGIPTEVSADIEARILSANSREELQALLGGV